MMYKTVIMRSRKTIPRRRQIRRPPAVGKTRRRRRPSTVSRGPLVAVLCALGGFDPLRGRPS
jgi:hypothetical protein